MGSAAGCSFIKCFLSQSKKVEKSKINGGETLQGCDLHNKKKGGGGGRGVHVVGIP